MALYDEFTTPAKVNAQIDAKLTGQKGEPLGLLQLDTNGKATREQLPDELLDEDSIDELGGVAANDTSILSASTVADFASIERKGRTRFYINDVDRGGSFSFLPASEGLTPDGGTIFATEGGFAVRNYNGFINVKWFGAKGDGVTDDSPAIQAAIDYFKGVGDSGSTARVRNTIFIPEGWYVLGSTLLLNKAVNIKGAGKFTTVLDSRTATGYLIDAVGANFHYCQISDFGMLFNEGGIKHTNIQKADFYNIWSGIGSLGGAAFHNLGCMFVRYKDITVTTNSTQLTTDYTKMCDYGILFEHSNIYPNNMSVVDSCIVEGCTLDGIRVINNNEPLSLGQGYVKFSNSTFEGNKRYDINLYKVFGAEFSQCHTEGIAADENVYIEGCQKVKFNGGIIGRLKVLGSSIGLYFDSCFFTAVDETDNCLYNTYLNCAFDSNSPKKFSVHSQILNTTLINNYPSDAIKTQVSEKSYFDGDTLTTNGNFRKWISATLPYEFYSTGSAVIDRETGTGLRYDGVYSAKITAVGTTLHQGLSYSIPNNNSSPSDWISVSFWVRRPAGQEKKIKIIMNLGFDAVCIIPLEETVADTFSFVSRSFKLSSQNAYITICPAETPVGGEYIYVDNLTIKKGRGVTTSFKNRTTESLNFGLDNTGYTSIFRGTAAPVTGSYVAGDIVINSVGTVGSVEGWKCTVTGSPGTWRPIGSHSAASANAAADVGATYSQTEVQAILTELRDLKTKMRTAGLLAT